MDFETLLKTTMGLDAISVGSATVERAVASRMASLRMEQSEEYWERVRSSDNELQELIENVIVPETWFFRDPEAFAALVSLVSEEWLPAHPPDVLNLLSGPCSTGEEPYSMAMALLNAGLPAERFKIDAVDISMRAIERARLAVYGPNSFRGESLGFRDCYFERASDGYHLAEPVRKLVSFHHCNLLAPELQVGSLRYDVIFCRNVLIYFDKETQQRVLKTLGALLTSGGFLFVGPAEAFVAACNGFKSVRQAMSFAFRKAHLRSAHHIPAPQTKAAKIVKFSGERDVRCTHKAAVPPAAIQIPTVPAPDDLEVASRLADSGRVSEAVAIFETHLLQNGPSPTAYYLLGLSLDAVGNMERAVECYRKVLYLKPDHSEALLHLAIASENGGDTATAERLRERARRAEKGTEH